MVKKLKILMVDKYFFIKGGAERYFFELKKILEEKGHQVIPFSMGHPDNYPSEFEKYFVSNIEFSQSSKLQKLVASPKIVSRVIYSIVARRRIEKLINVVRPDIAHLHMIDHQISPSILHSLKKYKIPILQTVHQYKLICPNYRLFNNRKGIICEKCLDGRYYHPIIENCHKSRFSALLLCLEMYLHKLMKIYEKNISVFHAPSGFMMQKLIQGGISRNQIIKLFYTINLKEFPFSPSYDEYFLYVGRLSEEKGVLTLLKAMRDIKESRLLIVGNGPLQKDLEDYAQKTNLTHVQFLGKKEGEDLKSLLKKAKFIVVPSEWYDNSPLVIYEAFSMGKPVIGSDIGGISELVDHGVNGLLFPSGDDRELAKQIKFLINHPHAIEQFGKAARKKAEAEFDPEIHFQKIYDIYLKLLS